MHVCILLRFSSGFRRETQGVGVNYRVCGSYNSYTIGSGSLARTANVDLVVSPVLCVRAWGPALIYAELHQIC